MALTIDLLNQYIVKQNEVKDQLSDDERLYMNYCFFYLVCDRCKCQYSEKYDAILVVTNDYKPQYTVKVSDLSLNQYSKGDGTHRRDALYRRMNSVPITKGTKNKVVDMLQVMTSEFNRREKTSLERLFKNHRVNINN